MISAQRAAVLSELQQEVLLMQGFKPANSATVDVGLGPLKDAFPNQSFPLGCVHEFLSGGIASMAATSGFVSGLLSTLMGEKGTSLWISSSRTLFPPALANYGLQPDKFIFIDLKKEKDVLWAMDEALKCGALTAVIGEMQELSFPASRRLQLAVEESKVNGFVLRTNPKKINPTACVSRWRITSLPSHVIDDLPGIGFPKWKVELLRIRNGKPGEWEIKWQGGRFQPVMKDKTFIDQQQKAG
jgi:protein ImuA